MRIDDDCALECFEISSTQSNSGAKHPLHAKFRIDLLDVEVISPPRVIAKAEGPYHLFRIDHISVDIAIAMFTAGLRRILARRKRR